MAIETGRPSQKTQRSRKGKKAWRKNIDLDDFEENIDDQHDAEIVLGPKTALFTVDKTGSVDGLTENMKRERRLKSHEILHARSAVPALIPQHKKKDKTKSKVIKDHKKLLERAGFTSKSSALANVERDGILKTDIRTDLWGTAAPSASLEAVPELRPLKRSAKRTAESLIPDAPIPGTPALSLPSAGQSYNPSLEDWKRTILLEHQKLEKDEEKRIMAEQSQAKIDAIIAETEARLAEPEDGESEDDATDEIIGKLAVNPPAPLKRKTRTQKNKQIRHKLRLFELSQLKLKKEFVKKLAAEASERKELQKTGGQELEDDTVKQKAPKRLLRAHSAHPVMEEPLAVKLSDELDDSMRRLRPEGDLLKERLRSLQARGIIEARKPVKRRKARTKMVEKYSYKDFV